MAPPVARKPLAQPRPFQAGDKVLDKDDVVGLAGDATHGRGVTRREARDVHMSAGAYRANADAEIAAGRRQNRKMAGLSRSVSKGRR